MPVGYQSAPQLIDSLIPIFLGQATESKKLTNTVQYYSLLVLE
jgi:hypothetical protein